MQASLAMPNSPATTTARGPSRPSSARGLALVALAAFAAVAAGAVVAAQLFGLGEDFVWRAGGIGFGGTLLIVALAARHLGDTRFGVANGVTLGRAVLLSLLVALLGEGGTPGVAWLVVALAVVAVLLDGVDGKLARSRGEATAFGARFDMETDALLIMVLSLLVWQHGKAGAWILLAGLLRYLFVAASYAAPWLGAGLPPSRRRQAVCVVQIVSLIGTLAPFVPPVASAPLALVGLVALGWSFGIDVAWLARHARA
jgi:phosphatidylglycerophosphate synthase